VFVDEGHFIKPDVIKVGPIAMLAMNACIMIASTPATGTSGINQILTAKLDGKPICTKIDFEFTCPSCKIRQIEDPSVVCMDRLYMKSQVQDNESMRIAKAASYADPISYAREHLGVSVFDNYAFIDPSKIQEIRDAPYYVPDVLPTDLYVSIDPNRGSKTFTDGKSSNYAFITAYMQKGTYVVKVFFGFIYIYIYIYIYICVLISITSNNLLFWKKK
jgi:hypothetical protein